jgi:Ca-activated chloride channel family protein
MAAVNDFVMEVGGRKIVGIVRSRAEAERIYQEALLRGQTASLLTQERPNIFTQSVANIEPGASVDIRITYFEKLAYEHGEYEYVFPMVVGPRYIPKGQQPDATLASEGGKRPPEIVPDAERITPPVLKPGHRSGHDISLAVTLDAGLPIVAEHAVAHQVEIERPSETKHLLRLASANEIPNRDFVLRWKVAGAETQFGVLSHRDRDGGYLSLTMQPPLEPRDEQVTPREITFIMDVSGSMMGTPIAMSKELVRRTLDGLRPEDAFNIVYFSGTNAQLWEEPHPRTPENVAAAKRFLENLSAGGGTEMLAGVERALHAAHDPKYLQMFVFLTDGYVGDEPRILSTIKTERGSARFFGFGIGSSVNRYLIDGIGQEGGGQSFVVIPRDSAYADRATAQLFAAIDSPVLVDVAIDWNGLPVTDAFPAKPRDLFAGQTIDVIARYDGPAHGTIYVTGRVGTRRVRYPVKVDLPEREPSHDALAPMWARAKIADLSSEMLAAGPERRSAIEQEITDLAVEHRLVSQYTAFVAVDESRIVGDGHPVRILQPVELPESVSWKGIFGESPVGVPVRIGAWGLDVQGTESGRVRVGDVDASSAAGRAGIRRGAVVRSVNGAPVSDVGQLERVLMQSGKSVTVELEPGGKAVLPSP